MRTCRGCGRDVSDGQHRCPNCGTPVGNEPAGTEGKGRDTAPHQHDHQPPRDQRATQSAQATEGESDGISRRHLLGAGGLVALAGGAYYVLGGGAGDSGEVDTWGTFRGDAARSGIAPSSAGPGENLTVSWTTGVRQLLEEDIDVDVEVEDDTVVSNRLSSPVVAGEVVVTLLGFSVQNLVSDELVSGFALVALEGETGEPEWTVLLSETDRQVTVTFDPVAFDGLLYAPYLTSDLERNLATVDAADGTVQNRLDLPLVSHPTVGEDTIYVSGQDALVALDGTDGDRRWHEENLSTTSRQRLSLADGTVFAQDSKGREFVALDAADGTQQWRQPVDVQDRVFNVPASLSPPVVSGDRCYVAGGLETFYQRGEAALVALDAQDGTEAWRYRLPGTSVPNDLIEAAGGGQLQDFSAVYGYPLVLDGQIIATGIGKPESGNPDDMSNVTHLFAVDENDGSLEWSVNVDTAFIPYAPVAAGDVVYVVGNTAIRAVSTDGATQDTIELGEEEPLVEKSPAIAHEHLYVPTVDGIVAIE